MLKSSIRRSRWTCQQFHNIFRLSEDTTRETFSTDIEIHTLELKKIHLLSATENPRLYRWSRFLIARTEEELELLAKEDSVMHTAKKTLEELSADEAAQKRAYDRETALRARNHTMAAERREGRVEGRAEGRAEGLRGMLVRQLTKKFGELSPWATERVAHASIEQLEVHVDAVLTAPTVEEALKLNA